jgi:hypothetical protein
MIRVKYVYVVHVSNRYRRRRYSIYSTELDSVQVNHTANG